MAAEFQVAGRNAKALFTLKLHRGDGMALLAMNWKQGTPPDDFVGFAIEYREPDGDRFYALKNRLAFPTRAARSTRTSCRRCSRRSRSSAGCTSRATPTSHGDFTYRVTPVFMSADDALSYGEPQKVAIELRRETYPGLLNVAFTRGFVVVAGLRRLLRVGRPDLDAAARRTPTAGWTSYRPIPRRTKALAWMGFEARQAILEVLDQAIADHNAKVRVIAYDLNEPEVVSRLEKLGKRG